jgi:hypothetical protein
MRDVKLVKVRNPDEAVRDLIAKLAASAPVDLPLNDRIELYKLAGQSDKIMDAINKQLSDSLDQPGSGEEADGQDDLLTYVKHKLDSLRRDGIQVSSAAQTTAGQLQKLREAKGWNEKANYEKALAVSLCTSSSLQATKSDVIYRLYKRPASFLLIRMFQALPELQRTSSMSTRPSPARLIRSY